MVEITFVLPSQLTPEDAQQIERAIAADPLTDLQAFANMIKSGSVGLLRVTGKITGMLMYQQIRHTGGDELFVWKIAGKNILTHFGDLMVELEKFALNKGCKWIGCSTDHEGSSRVVERTLNVRPVTKLYRKELSDGRQDSKGNNN